MRYLSEDEVTAMMGVGYLGEVRRGPGGATYQWVEGVDGLGNPIGFWRRLRRLARMVTPAVIPGGAAWAIGRRLLRQPLFRRIVTQALPFVPGVGPAAATALRYASPLLRQAGVAGYGGLGALYQAPDGTLYQMQGFGQDEELRGLAEEEELRGLGEEEELRGLGALYQAPDGTLYQVQGLAEEEELRGLAEDEELRGLSEEEELRGLAEDEELRGLAEDEELRGLAEDEELRGFAEEEELRGLAEEEELRGLEQGYVRDSRQASACCCPTTGAGRPLSGLEAYVPQPPPSTRWFGAPTQTPKMFESNW
jgi:hypothetical protein